MEIGLKYETISHHLILSLDNTGGRSHLYIITQSNTTAVPTRGNLHGSARLATEIVGQDGGAEKTATFLVRGGAHGREWHPWRGELFGGVAARGHVRRLSALAVRRRILLRKVHVHLHGFIRTSRLRVGVLVLRCSTKVLQLLLRR